MDEIWTNRLKYHQIKPTYQILSQHTQNDGYSAFGTATYQNNRLFVYGKYVQDYITMSAMHDSSTLNLNQKWTIFLQIT